MNDLVRTLRGLEKRLEQTNAGEVPGNLTAGSVVFVSATKSFTQDNTNLFWDDTNNRLGILTASPRASVHIGNGDSSAAYTKAQLAFGFNGSSDYPHFIHTRHNSSAASNAIDFYTCDGTQAGVFSTNAVHGMTIENGKVGIATTAPGYPLDVNGDMRAYVTSGATLHAEGTANSSWGRLWLLGKTAGGATVDWRIVANGSGSSELSFYDGVAATTRLLIDNGGHVLPNSAGAQNLGSASSYWNDVSYKTLTDRGCLARSSRWELPDGRFVSGLEAICAMQAHPTEQTIYGMTKLDYGSVAKVSQKPAPIATEDVYEDVVIEEADPKRGKDRVTERRLKWKKGEKMGTDGVEMTSVFSQVLDALVEINERLRRLEA